MAHRLNEVAETPTKKIDPEKLINQAFKVSEKVVKFQAKIKVLEKNYSLHSYEVGLNGLRKNATNIMNATIVLETYLL